jgi:hypothetical protein
MEVKLDIILHEFEKDDYEIRVVGLEFELGVADDSELREIRKYWDSIPMVLKLPTEKRRRMVAYHLLRGIKWTLHEKARDRVVFKADIPVNLWVAFSILCTGKYVLTQKKFEEWIKMEPEELVSEFEVIALAKELSE